MKSKKNKNSNQKGISKLVIIGIVLVFLVLVLIIANTMSGSDSATKATIENKNNYSLSKVETDSYVFYYPTSYTKTDPTTDQAILNYSRPNSSYAEAGEGISLDVYPSQNRKAKPSSDLCNTVVNNLFKSSTSENVTIAKVNAVEYENSHGCEMVVRTKIDQGNLQDETISHFKQIWYKNGDNYNVYAANASYFASAPKEEADAIDQAVSLFSLK